MDSDEVIRNANSLATCPRWCGEKHAFAFLRFSWHLSLASAMRRMLPRWLLFASIPYFRDRPEENAHRCPLTALERCPVWFDPLRVVRNPLL